MENEVIRELARLGESLETGVDVIGVDEVRERASRLSDGQQAADTGHRSSRAMVALAAALVLVVGGLVVLSQRAVAPGVTGDPVAGGALVDALVGRTWVSIDHGGTRVPHLQLDAGEGGQVAVVSYDGCNRGEGTFRLDGNLVAESMIMSTLAGCGGENDATAIFPGTRFDLLEGVLTVTNADSSVPSTRYIELSSMSPITPAEMVGTFTIGVWPVTFTASTVLVEGCEIGWSDAGGGVAFEGAAACANPAGSAQHWWTGIFDTPWSDLRSDGELVIVSAGDGFSRRLIRLDRTGPGSELRPSLPSFLGAVAGRTWILDTASPANYDFGARPTFRIAALSDATGGVAPKIVGFDGCAPFETPGDWVSSGNGWTLNPNPIGAVGSTDAPELAAGDCQDGRRITLATAAVMTLEPFGRLVVAQPDGSTLEFQDPVAVPNSDLAFSPIGHVAGTWRLDDGAPPLEIALGEPGAGSFQPPGSAEAADGYTFTFGSCTVGWFGTGNRWFDTTPDWPADPHSTCPTTPADRTSTLFFDMVLSDGPITAGVTEDDAKLYLSNATGTLGFVLTRV
jgi:hypothetical protein